MRKFICFVMSMVLLLCLSGCNKKNDSMENPASFYYRNAVITYDSSQAVIAPEVRDVADRNLSAFINLYLAGPTSEYLVSPFPAGVSVYFIVQNNNRLYIGLNQPFDTLSGMDLTIACACLYKTMSELTQCDTIEISVNGGTLNGSSSIVIDQNNLLLLDNINQD